MPVSDRRYVCLGHCSGSTSSGVVQSTCLVTLAPIEQIGMIHAALADLPVRVMVFTTGEPHGVVFPPSDY